jgi:hypothetical protein
MRRMAADDKMVGKPSGAAWWRRADYAYMAA